MWRSPVLFPRLAVKAQQAARTPEVTFTKDIAPILQRSCQNCHRPGQVAPMSLLTYEEARPWARSMKARTAIRDKAGAMPPWYIEKNIGIQHYKNDPSLSDEEVAKIAKWADTGAPRGNLADMPAARVFPDGASWHAGEPDLIVESPEITVKANTPDWWGEFPPTKLPITEDRYVKSVEIREVNNFSTSGGPRDRGPALRVAPPDLGDGAVRRERRSARRVGDARRGGLARARSRPQRRHLRRRTPASC